MFLLITFLLGILCASPVASVMSEEPPFVVVIDPGHGGHDPGCSGAGSQEKAITLALGLDLRDRIRGAYPDVKVILTREKDVFIPLHKRSALANASQADLFISLHCNAIENAPRIRGSETYVLGLERAAENFAVARRENQSILLEENHQERYGDFDPNSIEAYILMSMYQNAYLDRSITFAGHVETQIKAHTGLPSKGVKQAGFLVLREAAMPSVLVETGFLTNVSDEKFLLSEAGQQKMVEGLFAAFVTYLAEVQPVVVSGIDKPVDPADQTTLAESSRTPKEISVEPPVQSSKAKDTQVTGSAAKTDQPTKQKASSQGDLVRDSNRCPQQATS